MRLKPAVRFGLALVLLHGIPGLPFYEALAQTSSQTGLGANGLPIYGNGGDVVDPALDVSASPSQGDGRSEFYGWVDQQSIRGLASKADGVRSANAVADFRDAAASLGAAAQGPATKARLWVVPGRFQPPTKRDAPATHSAGERPSEFESGKSLLENLRSFESYWSSRAPGLHGAPDDELGRRTESDFQKLVRTQGPVTTYDGSGRRVSFMALGDDAVRVNDERGVRVLPLDQFRAYAREVDLPVTRRFFETKEKPGYEVRITREFADSVRAERKGFRAGEWGRLYDDLTKEVKGEAGSKLAKGRPGIRKLRWMDRNRRLFFHVDHDDRRVTLLDYKSKGELEQYANGGEAGFYDALGSRTQELASHFLGSEAENSLKAELFRSAGSDRVLHAAPEPEKDEPPAEPQAGKSGGGEDRPRGRGPPKRRVPVSTSIKYWATYLGSFGAAVAGAGALLAAFAFMSPVAAFLGAGLMVANAASQVLREVVGGGKESYSPTELQALAAQQTDAQLRQVLLDLASQLGEAQKISVWLTKRLGRPEEQAPPIYWYKPAPYNNASWGFSFETGWIGLGEFMLRLWLREDWRVIAGAMAHEMAHIELGDWKRFIRLHTVSKLLYQIGGVSGVVQSLVRERRLDGEKRWMDRYSAGVLGAALLAAGKAAGLFAGSWYLLLLVPAAWLLFIVSAALKQTYQRIQEVRADQFAAALTKPGYMIGYLLKIRSLAVGEKGAWWSRPFESHPATDDRILAVKPDFELPSPDEAPPVQPAGPYIDKLAADIEAARGELEKQLGDKVEKIESGFADGRFVFVLHPKPGVKREELQGRYREVPYMTVSDLPAYQTAAEYVARVKAELAAAEAEVRQAAPGARVSAVFDGKTFVVAVDSDDDLPDLPEAAGRFPVVRQKLS